MRRSYWTNRAAIFAEIGELAVIVHIEGEYPRENGSIIIEQRFRPIVAFAACSDETVLVADASNRQEETVTIIRCKQHPVHAIPRCPSDCCIFEKFLKFFVGGHLPAIAPMNCSSVVFRQQVRQGIGETTVAQL